MLQGRGIYGLHDSAYNRTRLFNSTAPFGSQPSSGSQLVAMTTLPSMPSRPSTNVTSSSRTCSLPASPSIHPKQSLEGRGNRHSTSSGIKAHTHMASTSLCGKSPSRTYAFEHEVAWQEAARWLNSSGFKDNDTVLGNSSYSRTRGIGTSAANSRLLSPNASGPQVPWKSSFFRTDAREAEVTLRTITR